MVVRPMNSVSSASGAPKGRLGIMCKETVQASDSPQLQLLKNSMKKLLIQNIKIATKEKSVLHTGRGSPFFKPVRLVGWENGQD